MAVGSGEASDARVSSSNGTITSERETTHVHALVRSAAYPVILAFFAWRREKDVCEIRAKYWWEPKSPLFVWASYGKA
jgi:hypothetical protein